jgi:ABC-type microcin C transport system permease subunit YejE
MALSRAKWIYATFLNNARDPALDRQIPLPFRCASRHPLLIDTAMRDFEAQLLVCWRLNVVLSPLFMADLTRGNSEQCSVN